MTVYADRETGACDLFRRCCINLRATKNKKENALQEFKKGKQKNNIRVGDQQTLKKIKRKKNIGGATRIVTTKLATCLRCVSIRNRGVAKRQVII